MTPFDGQAIARVIGQTDRALLTLEDGLARHVLDAVRSDQARYEARARPAYEQARSEAAATDSDVVRTALAAALAGTLAFDVALASSDAIATFATAAADTGATGSTRLLAGYGVPLGITGLPVLRDRTNEAADAARVALGAEMGSLATAFAAGRAHVLRRAVREARPWGWVEAELRAEGRVTAAHAEMLARTWGVTLNDEAHRAAYDGAGVGYGQLIATQDNRVCGFCAARSGNVYRLGELVLPLHPRCRCMQVPWTPALQRGGYTDDAWFRAHHADTTIRAREQGETLHYHAAAPSERYRGRDAAPTPVWTPTGGYTP